ncbi:MAG: GDP-mannose 4,6-dehydratase [Singulisphaera sp.]
MLGRFVDLLNDPGPDPLHLVVGDLDARRDFIDVRDVARALMALALLGHPGQAYHVGTGRSHRVRQGLDRLIELSGRDVEVEVDPLRPRGRGPDDSRADPTRLMTHTGWRPEIGWEQSLADLWDEAKARLRLPLTGSAAPV